jgi:hypothetical protein
MPALQWSSDYAWFGRGEACSRVEPTRLLGIGTRQQANNSFNSRNQSDRKEETGRSF